MIAVLLAAALAQEAPAPGPAAGMPELSALSSTDRRRVTRRFTPAPDGGTFEVLLDSPARVAVARKRLRADTARFAGGRFRHPVLSAGAKRIDVAYADTEQGGRIRFITSDPALVQALHAWLAGLARGR